MKQSPIALSDSASSAAAARRRAAVGLAATTAFAALTTLGARVQFQLPFTPVPVTGQVFCVLLAGCVLGARLGFVSQVEYLAAGAAGLPVFAAGGGAAYLLGPTGGYLAGFPIAALAAGAISGRRRRCGTGLMMVACLSGVATIYLFGAAWYGIWCAATGGGVGAAGIVGQSVAPFIVVDVPRAGLAAAVAAGLRRRLSFE